MSRARIPQAPNSPPVMKRRTFLALLPGSLLAAPLAARDQPAGKVYRVGLLKRPECNNPSHDVTPCRAPSHTCARGKAFAVTPCWRPGAPRE